MKELLDSDRINFLVWRFVVYSPCTPMYFFEMQPANLALFFNRVADSSWNQVRDTHYHWQIAVVYFSCYVFVGYFL